MTPVDEMKRLGARLGVPLFCKRDDLLPGPGGGNKVRKLAYILAHAEDQGHDAIVTCGSTQSNHCRAAAIEAARRGWRCHLVLHEGSGPATVDANHLLMSLSGATQETCRPDEISTRMDSAMERMKAEGSRPYYVRGGGHDVHGARAYMDAVAELDIDFDYLILASGTGATQAGIIAGLALRDGQSRVIGISVARSRARAEEVILDSIEELRAEVAPGLRDCEVRVDDRFVGGGYGIASAEVFETIREVMRLEGVPLDPTYTGKAFTGLVSLCRDGTIQEGSRVLFWHTGGLLNLLSSGHDAALLSKGRAPSST